MTFDEWWGTLTEAEHKLIGRTTAKYVWLCASDNEREECAKVCEEAASLFGNSGHIGVCLTNAGAIRARGNK